MATGSGDELTNDSVAHRPETGETNSLAGELYSLRTEFESTLRSIHSALEEIRGALHGQGLAMEGLAANQAAQRASMEGFAGDQVALQASMQGLATSVGGELRGLMRELQVKNVLDRAWLTAPRAAAGVGSTNLLDRVECATIFRNHTVLRALEWHTQERLATFDDAAVLDIARAAAEWSCMNHPGVFASRALESALRDVGRRQLEDEPCWQARGGRRRVLHVMTVAYPIGGHTRLAENWMRSDPSSEHSVLLSEQGENVVPSDLIAATDGRVDQLTSATQLGRVRELGRLLTSYDSVALHIHPYDVVAVAACADAAKRPPTLFVDHGDHIFWLGVGAADAVVSARPSGATLAVSRRGIKPDQSVTIPLPLNTAVEPPDAVTAKARLGLPADARVMLTMASAHKYGQVGKRSFASLVERVLSAVPSAYLLAVGPRGSEPGWQTLIQRFGERVRAFGPTAETALMLDAADLYLDSFPFGSPTSLFEAALHGIMPFSLRDPGAGVLTVEDADVELPGATDAESWVKDVEELLGNDDFRTSEGHRLALEIADAHGRARLAPLLERVYSRASHQADLPMTELARPLTQFDIALVRYQRSSGLGHSLEYLLESCGLVSAGIDPLSM
jgi:hypothetical protein